MNGSVLNQKAIRTLALRLAETTGRKFTRVSGSFVGRIDAKVRAMVAAEIHALPSKGKTIA